MNFHLASRGGGSPLTLTFQQGGSCLNCSNKKNKKKCLARFARSCLLINLLYLVRKVDKYLSFSFCKHKSYSILVFYCYNHTDFDRKLIDQTFR